MQGQNFPAYPKIAQTIKDLKSKIAGLAFAKKYKFLTDMLFFMMINNLILMAPIAEISISVI